MKEDKNNSTRIEEDFLGKIEVPADAYYGGFTVRANKVFKLSGNKVNLKYIYSLVTLKKACALANNELGVIDKKVADAIAQACDEILSGKFDKEFILDAFQAGAGTPTNMNTNEVIANRANEILGGKKGEYKPVHPNNHVNAAQSSNDVMPTALRLAALLEVNRLYENISLLEKSFDKKSAEYKNFVKVGRTHLQDAVPITFGQVFEAYSEAIKHDHEYIKKSFESLLVLGIGGTALGTGINTHPKFKQTVTKHLTMLTGLKVTIPKSTVETTHSMNAFLYASSSLRALAITLNRISNDIRLFVSGPKTGINELSVPEIEPGSSIMPGKVNPSVPEAINFVCAQVISNDLAVLQGAMNGQFELNFFAPLLVHNLLESLELLINGCHMFNEHCIKGLKINEEQCKKHFDNSLIYATALNPYLGYSMVSKLVTEAYRNNKSLKDLILERKLIEKADLEKIIASAVGPSEVDLELVKKYKK